MRKPTPVTTSSMTSESWSRTKLKSTWSAPTLIQVAEGFDVGQMRWRGADADESTCALQHDAE